MKIKYDFGNKKEECYDEANGIYLLRKKLKKNYNIKIRSYSSLIRRWFIILFLFEGIMLVTFAYIQNADFFRFSMSIFILTIFIYYYLISLLKSSLKNNLYNTTGEIEFSEEVIIDTPSKGLQVGVKYEDIDMIVITNNILVVFTRYPVMFILTNGIKDKFLKQLKKHCDVLVIDKSDEAKIEEN